MWYYVYILELNNGKYYVGCTENLKERLTRHSKGYVPATAPYLPVKLLWRCSFPDKYQAYEFERYLKSGSGRAFALKHLLANKDD
jgi:predicted GIY-YIG superfamily endonuclease